MSWEELVTDETFMKALDEAEIMDFGDPESGKYDVSLEKIYTKQLETNSGKVLDVIKWEMKDLSGQFAGRIFKTSFKPKEPGSEKGKKQLGMLIGDLWKAGADLARPKKSEGEEGKARFREKKRRFFSNLGPNLVSLQGNRFRIEVVKKQDDQGIERTNVNILGPIPIEKGETKTENPERF